MPPPFDYDCQMGLVLPPSFALCTSPLRILPLSPPPPSTPLTTHHSPPTTHHPQPPRAPTHSRLSVCVCPSVRSRLLVQCVYLHIASFPRTPRSFLHLTRFNLNFHLAHVSTTSRLRLAFAFALVACQPSSTPTTRVPFFFTLLFLDSFIFSSTRYALWHPPRLSLRKREWAPFFYLTCC